MRPVDRRPRKLHCRTYISAAADYTWAPLFCIDVVPILTEFPTQSIADSGPVVFGRNADLFGWLHRPATPTGKPAIVICNPVGFEFIRAFRTLRILAGKLADAGHCVLRFDYRTTGDSAGDELDESRVENFLESTREALEFVADANGNRRVALIGLRLGATLAAKMAETLRVDQLVLWAPCDSGAIYVREQQIMAAAQKKRLTTADDSVSAIEGVDAGGFLLTPATQAELSGLKPGTAEFRGAPDILLLNRDDIRVPPNFAESLESRGASLTVAASPGFKDMMLPPQLAAVPHEAIDLVADWFAARSRPSENGSTAPASGHAAVPLHAGDGVEELPLTFGPDRRLFGILSRAGNGASTGNPAVILLCGGATHRIAANRMYVTLARHLAATGTNVLRLDLAGIGDSRAHDNTPSNKPYTDKLVDDVEAAMDVTQAVTGNTRFILFGLCSGAYAAMRTATESQRIDSVILVNQLVYHVSADDLQGLATGAIASAHELDFPRSSSLPYRAMVRILKRISPTWGSPGEWLSPWLVGSRVRRDLEALIARGIHPAFVFSSRDDAVDALGVTCGRQLRKWIDAGQATTRIFAGTDHTFSPTGSQRELVAWVADHVALFKRT